MINISIRLSFLAVKQTQRYIMRKTICLLLLSGICFSSIAQAASPEKSGKERDLYNRLQWVKPEAVRLAIDDMSHDKTFDKGTAEQLLIKLEELLKPGFEGILQNDPAAIARGKQALELQRSILLSNPLLKNGKIIASRYKLPGNARKAMTPELGTQRNNWTNQQTNRYRGFDAEIVELSELNDRLSMRTVFKPADSAVIADLKLHWDGEHIMFTSVTADDRLNVFEVTTAGTGFRPLIETPEPDLEFYDATYLPDGRILTGANVGYHGVPCINGNAPVGNMMLYSPGDKKLRRVTFDQDANWNPVVMHNGRVMYTRWEYTDLMHYYSRFVMHMNPDGTEQKALFGSGAMFPNSTFDIQPLPGHSSAFAGIISGHHGVARSGRLILFDPTKARKGVEGMLQEIPYRNRPIDPIVKDRLVDGVWPQFIKPMPVNDKYFLVTAKLSPDALWGIYLVDVFDNVTCLHEAEGEGYISPILVRKSQTPPVIPDRVKLSEKEATVFIQDIYEGEGLRGVPKGTVKSLRIHAYEYAYIKSPSNHEAMGIQSGWDIKRNLGTVPVEEDGSAIFKIPANTPISIQPLDRDGRAIQWMRSWLTGMPGEIISCVGCHEDQNSIAIPKRVTASTKLPVALTAPEGGIRPFTFDLEVQPVLDRACIACHDGSEGKPDFRGGKKDARGFGTSYLALHPYVRRQGPEADMAVLQPYEYHANTSELIRMLEVGHHNVKLTKEEWSALTNWIDYNAPDKGIFGPINPLKGVDQYTRRIELSEKYAGKSVCWKQELTDYATYLKTKGTIKPELPESLKSKKQKSPKVKGWPFSSGEAQDKQKALGETRLSVDVAPGIKINFVKIPSGSFVMGCNTGSADHAPAGKVRIDKPFWMAEVEITNEQYAALVPDHDSRCVDQFWKDHTHAGYPANLPHQPVIRVSYRDALAYCETLSRKTGLNITLPTEAQWEWACRAGSDKDFWFGDANADFAGKENLADARLSDMAVKGVDPKPMSHADALFKYYNYLPKAAGVNDGAMIQTDSKDYQANPFGLHAMHGNIAEWTRSAYLPYPYKANAQEEGERYVVRGGSYLDRPKYSTAYTRKAYYPWQRVFNVGFRVIIEQ